MKPGVDGIPGNHEATRVVYADIGLTTDGHINFGAPVIGKYGIRGIPYFAIVDGNGKITSQGDAAREQVTEWMSK